MMQASTWDKMADLGQGSGSLGSCQGLIAAPVPERPGSTFIGEPGVYEKCRISQGDAQSGAADLLNIHSNDLL